MCYHTRFLGVGAKEGMTGDIISLNTNYLSLMRGKAACSGWVWGGPRVERGFVAGGTGGLRTLGILGVQGLWREQRVDCRYTGVLET